MLGGGGGEVGREGGSSCDFNFPYISLKIYPVSMGMTDSLSLRNSQKLVVF